MPLFIYIYEEKFKLGYISGKEKRKQSGIMNGNRFEHRLQLFWLGSIYRLQENRSRED